MIMEFNEEFEHFVQQAHDNAQRWSNVASAASSLKTALEQLDGRDTPDPVPNSIVYTHADEHYGLCAGRWIAEAGSDRVVFEDYATGYEPSALSVSDLAYDPAYVATPGTTDTRVFDEHYKNADVYGYPGLDSADGPSVWLVQDGTGRSVYRNRNMECTPTRIESRAFTGWLGRGYAPPEVFES